MGKERNTAGGAVTGGGDAGLLAEVDEFGNGGDPEFLHEAAAVDLDRVLRRKNLAF